ncbi:glycoside hydrolase family 28 protein [Labilibaculum sp. A4]|uniref:glycoside hydrolase family 28 protein n=1 Tax=Labilibaculum euxinus TaxID=2686357 RepID=UPI000F61938A|nr:glycoside hydrolase family 28 protein [Labilibaculum euxinus]MDQ1771050.1 glycoside hydrolase family 28 protein [Labilibaculum euxinus]MWN76943.1 glycoside hydrolase family 28 protein [Labilibaculum euxinus]
MSWKQISLIGIFLMISISSMGQDFEPDLSSCNWIADVGARTQPVSRGVIYNPSDFGAVGDGVTLCTKSIQESIDKCAELGGGVVRFQTGIYLTGSVFLKSNVILDIPKGVQIEGSQDINDYKEIPTRVAGIEMDWPAGLINIIDQHNVAITGDGVVHGKGKVFWDKYHSMRKEYDPKGLRWVVDYDCKRPRGIIIENSKDVMLKDFVLYQAGFWSVHILYSEYVTVQGMTINNNIEGKGPSTDGVDIDSSSRILVQNCYVNCNDDNFCLKAGRDSDGLKVNRPCEYIVIRDCIAGRGDGLFTCGSETSGSVRNVLIYNMKGLGTKYGLRFKSTSQRGGTIENIYMYNIQMDGVRDPFVVNLNWNPSYSNSKLPEGYNYGELPIHWKKLLGVVPPEKGMPKFKNMFFENVHAINAQTCIKVTGIEESTIDNFQFKNVSFEGDNAGNISYAKNWKFTDFKVRGAKENKLKLSNNKDVRIKD